MDKKYCVYVTEYNGTLMPTYYIGSSSTQKIDSGYRGSVKSKKHKSAWISELETNPQLFETALVSVHETRKEALAAELELQLTYRATTNPDFINESYAMVNGFFGRDVSGSRNHMFGKKVSDETRAKLSKNHHDVSGKNNPMYGRRDVKSMLGRQHSIESRSKMTGPRDSLSGKNNPMYGKVGDAHPWFGSRHSNESIQKMREPKLKVTCPHCMKVGGKPAMVRFHFDNCKSKQPMR